MQDGEETAVENCPWLGMRRAFTPETQIWQPDTDWLLAVCRMHLFRSGAALKGYL